MRFKHFAIVPFAAALVFAESRGFEGPVSGVVHDAVTRSLRPVLGVPGAARLGAPVITGIDAAATAPDGRASLISKDGQLWLLTRLGDAEPVLELLREDTPLRMAWSSESTGAAVAFAGGSVEVLRFEGANHEWVLSSPVGGQVTALAVAPAGRSAAILTEDGSLLITQEGGLAAVPGIAPAAVAFATSGTLYAAEKAGRIYRLNGSEAVALNAEPPEGAEVVGLAVTGNRLFAVDAALKTVHIYDTATGEASDDVALDETPTGVLALGKRTLLVGTARDNSTQPLFLLETAGQPSVYFVPAGDAQ